MKVLEICNRSSTITRTEDDPREDLFNVFNSKMTYPPNVNFQHSYDCWQEHQSILWSSHENHPENDKDKFSLAPEEFQHIVLSMVGCILIGDDVVLDNLQSEELLKKITSAEVKAMFADQAARENVHKEVYSKMLDISDSGDWYRSYDFYCRYMRRFAAFSQKIKCTSVAEVLYFIMLCENILFAPMFHCLCYLAVEGHAPKICDSNLQVMRDEYVHYKHARGLLASMQYKTLNLYVARRWLNEIENLSQSLIYDIVGSYQTEFYSAEIAIRHLKHVCHAFRLENSLYLSSLEMEENACYNTSPSASFMSLPQNESKINLMESNPTVYMVPGTVADIYYSDDDGEEDDKKDDDFSSEEEDYKKDDDFSSKMFDLEIEDSF